MGSKRLRMRPVKIERGEFIKTVQKKKYNIEEICLGCLKFNKDNKTHPIFKGGICAACTECLKDALTQNETEHKFCIVCGGDSDAVHCQNESCEGTFCRTCINEFSPKGTWLKVFWAKKWNCFRCEISDDFYLTKRENWKENVYGIFLQKIKPITVERTNKPLRVLSLFDGIGAGYVALQKLGIAIDEYFGSEILPDAINISSVNSFGKIKHLGNVCSITQEVLKTIMPIDILIGGSPCVELSLVNPARSGLFDIETTGVLFFEYVRILNQLRTLDSKKTLLFLYENTAAMPKDYRNTISRFLDCDPVLLDAKHFSPMKRPRLFWGNLPGMEENEIPNNHADVRLETYLTKHCNRIPFANQIRTITTNSNSLRQGIYKLPAVLMEGKEDSLWITEIEKVFGFNEHYTDIGNISSSKRLSLIGSSWSIPVICHLFRRLPNYFKVEENNSQN